MPCADDEVDGEALAGREELDALLGRVLALRAELGEPVPTTAPDLSPEPAVATWQAVALAPLGPLDAQRVLATDGARERLDLVLGMLDEEADVLAQRLAGG